MTIKPPEYRSSEISFAANGSESIDMHWLDLALDDYTNPRIDRFELHVRGTITTGTGATFTVAHWHKLVRRLLMSDNAGQRVDLDADAIRIAPQVLLGPQVLLAPDAILAEQTAAPFEMVMPIPFEWTGQYNTNDTRPHVKEFCKKYGGRVQLDFPSATLATGITVVSMTYTLVARVSEAFTAEVPGRFCILRDDVAKKSDNYDIDGRLIAAVLYAPALASYAAYGEFDSTTLRKTRQRFNTEAARHIARGVGGNMSSDSIVASGGVRLIQAPQAKINDMPVMERLHFDLLDGAPISGSKLLKVVITDRSRKTMGRILGRAGLKNVDEGTGSISTPKGKRPMSGVEKQLSKHVAVRGY